MCEWRLSTGNMQTMPTLLLLLSAFVTLNRGMPTYPSPAIKTTAPTSPRTRFFTNNCFFSTRPTHTTTPTIPIPSSPTIRLIQHDWFTSPHTPSSTPRTTPPITHPHTTTPTAPIPSSPSTRFVTHDWFTSPPTPSPPKTTTPSTEPSESFKKKRRANTKARRGRIGRDIFYRESDRARQARSLKELPKRLPDLESKMMPELLRREWDSDICRLLPESYQLLDHAQKTSQFSLKVTSSPVMPGKVIKVTLNVSEDADGDMFTYILQAQSTQNSKPCGKFIRCVGSTFFSCGQPDNTVKGTVSGVFQHSEMWQAPPDLMGDVMFHATFVSGNGKYWTDVTSEVIKHHG